MGKRGPLPNPKSSRSQRRGVKAFSAKGRMPKCPETLGAAGRSLWNRIVRGLHDKKAIGSLHLYSLTQAARLADEIDMLQDDIAKKGLTDMSTNGIEYLRPQVKQLNTARRQMQFYEKEFGLTSASDERLHGTQEPPKEDDPLDILKTLGATRN